MAALFELVTTVPLQCTSVLYYIVTGVTIWQAGLGKLASMPMKRVCVWSCLGNKFLFKGMCLAVMSGVVIPSSCAILRPICICCCLGCSWVTCLWSHILCYAKFIFIRGDIYFSLWSHWNIPFIIVCIICTHNVCACHFLLICAGFLKSLQDN